LTATQNFPNSDNDNDNDFPEIDKLFSGIQQKNILASTDPNSSNDNDGDGFIDIDKLLSGM
jgi:hypothetical protein